MWGISRYCKCAYCCCLFLWALRILYKKYIVWLDKYIACFGCAILLQSLCMAFRCCIVCVCAGSAFRRSAFWRTFAAHTCKAQVQTPIFGAESVRTIMRYMSVCVFVYLECTFATTCNYTRMLCLLIRKHSFLLFAILGKNKKSLEMLLKLRITMQKVFLNY